MRRPPAVLALIVALGAALIFANLDNRYLWDDEAETALLAQRVLRFGVPIAWDGRDLVSQECSTDFDANYLWRQTPWAQFYLAALSFKLFGADTLTARLPFALLGVLSILSLYALGCAIFADRALALGAAGLLALSVPFLLHVRQARYYAVAVLATVWVLYFFFALVRDRRGALLGLVLAMTVLFHANYLVFFATAAGLALAFFALPHDTMAFLRLAGAAVATLAINFPWLAIFNVRGKTDVAFASASVGFYLQTLWGYVTRIELYACSILVLAALATTRVVLGRSRLSLDSTAARACVALGLFAAGHVLLISAAPFAFFRYIVTLLPVFALLQAAVLRALWPVSRVAAVVGMVVLVVPDRADLVRGSFGSTPVKYVDEVTHNVPGPMAALVSYLRVHGRPGEQLFITYGDLPLRFYTRLDIRGGQGCQSLIGWPPPDWIIPRFFFRFRTNAAGADADAEQTARYLRSQISLGRYRETGLPTVDTVWENIPEPNFHVYREPREGPRLTIYRRVTP